VVGEDAADDEDGMVTETSEGANAPSGTQALDELAMRLDALRARVEADVGDRDVVYMRRVRRTSTALEVVGRTLIHIGVDPITLGGGVIALWAHKQLEAIEIGHSVLHGAFDRLRGADDLRSTTFRWRFPVDEESWRHAHNVRHHQYTNIAGRDPDIHFGQVRLNSHTPHRRIHYVQVPMMLAHFAHFGFAMNLHVTGVIDAVAGNGRPERFDFLPDDAPATRRAAYRRALRKFVPYYGRELLLFPALAGPFWWKVLIANIASEVMRDAYTAATVVCGHVGDGVADFPAGTRAGERGRWYRMQIEAAQNFAVRWPISVLCGALDLQIEHHLFPKLPPNRLREIADEVRRACEAAGVRYRCASWPRTLSDVARRLWQLSFADHAPIVSAFPRQRGRSNHTVV
jgi:linoleoyl-CoA desaturase